MMILSGDPPRSRALTILLILIVLALLATPWLFPGAKALNVAAKICIFAALVASYDLLLGYTGTVSFAHTMFYGIGSYAIAIALYSLGPSWLAVATGIVIGLPLAMLLALAIGLFSLRVAAIFFAMITLAVASAFQVLASQLSWLTGGEDGKSFSTPIHGKLLAYYLIFAVTAVSFLLLLRLVNSPFGRVLLAIRENEFRAEAIGYRTAYYRTAASAIAALAATIAGVLLSLWLRYTGPDSTLSFDIMIDVLLMTVIGGTGSLYGSIIGATLIVIAQTYLRDALSSLQDITPLFNPDRWRLWLGLIFIFCVYLFPEGIVGKLRSAAKGKMLSRN